MTTVTCFANSWCSMDCSSPSGTEGTALLAHEACHNNHLVLIEGMLLDDTVHIVIICKLVTPDIHAAWDVPAAKVIVSDIQNAGFGLLRPASCLD